VMRLIFRNRPEPLTIRRDSSVNVAPARQCVPRIHFTDRDGQFQTGIFAQSH